MKFKKVLLGSSLFVSCFKSSFAIFGFGDIVFDPQNYWIAGQSFSNGIKQYSELANQTNNQVKEIAQMYEQIQLLENQVKKWNFKDIRNWEDASNRITEALNLGDSLFATSSHFDQFIARASGNPSLADKGFMDTLGGALRMVREQNDFIKADARAYDDLKWRMTNDVKGGTSAIGAFANLNENLLNHVDDLGGKFDAMINIQASEGVKDQLKKESDEAELDRRVTNMLNESLEDNVNFDYSRMKPIYTSSKQYKVEEI